MQYHEVIMSFDVESLFTNVPIEGLYSYKYDLCVNGAGFGRPYS